MSADDYARYRLNSEPPHDTDSPFCWCAPYIETEGDTEIITHRDLPQIIAYAISISAAIAALKLLEPDARSLLHKAEEQGPLFVHKWEYALMQARAVVAALDELAAWMTPATSGGSPQK